MARRTPNTTPSIEDEVTTPTLDQAIVDGTVSTEGEVTPEVQAEADAIADGAAEQPATDGEQAPETPATPAEQPIDLTAFQAAANTAADAADEGTGELAVAILEPVKVAYRDLDGIKAKNAAKAWLADQMKEAMNKLNIKRARSFMILKDEAAVAATGGSTTPKPPTDPILAYATQVAALQIAAILPTVPEGVDADAARAKVEELIGSVNTDQVSAYRTWLDSTAEDKGDAPEVPDLLKAAFKLAGGKVPGIRRAASTGGVSSGERRDVGKHILNAFASKDAGTFLTVAEIVNTPSEEYGSDKPSPGAVSARLFPSSGKATTVAGIQAESRELNGRTVKGAVKVAQA